MKKTFYLLLIALFSLCLAAGLASCKSLSNGGGLVGKLFSPKGENQSESNVNDEKPTDNLPKEEGQSGSANDGNEGSSENQNQEEKTKYITVTYLCDQIEGDIQGVAVQNIIAGENSSLVTAVAKEGYAFICWDDGKTNATRQELNITENLTVTANFRKIEYITLIYNYDNGEQNGEVTVEKNSNVKLPTPSRMGYTFKGWYINGDMKQGGEAITVTSDITARATWEINVYNINYVLNGGTLENAKTEFTINDLPLTLGYPAGETENLSFVKWTTDQGGNEEISQIPKEESSLKNYTVYAFYEDSADCLTYKYNSELEGYEVLGYSGKAKAVTIPSAYKNVKVKSIGERAFYGCRGLTTLAPLRTKSPERAFSVLSPAPGTGNLK